MKAKRTDDLQLLSFNVVLSLKSEYRTVLDVAYVYGQYLSCCGSSVSNTHLAGRLFNAACGGAPATPKVLALFKQHSNTTMQEYKRGELNQEKLNEVVLNSLPALRRNVRTLPDYLQGRLDEISVLQGKTPEEIDASDKLKGLAVFFDAWNSQIYITEDNIENFRRILAQEDCETIFHNNCSPTMMYFVLAQLKKIFKVELNELNLDDVLNPEVKYIRLTKNISATSSYKTHTYKNTPHNKHFGIEPPCMIQEIIQDNPERKISYASEHKDDRAEALKHLSADSVQTNEEFLKTLANTHSKKMK